MNLEYEQKVVCELAEEAGERLLRYYQKFHPEQGNSATIPVQLKQGNEPVTEADRVVNEFCVQRLRQLFPQDGILSEELPDDGSRYRAKRTWMIDPIDGTKEFIAGRTGFAIMIGLLFQNRPVLGVVYAPLLRSLYFAVVGQGAFVLREGKTSKIAVSSVDELSDAMLVRSMGEVSILIEQLKQKASIRDEMRIGSIGVKMCLIAEGKAELYLHIGNKAKLWDTCAPEILVIEAGGNVTDLKGHLLDYTTKQVAHQKGILVCNGNLFSKTKQLL